MKISDLDRQFKYYALYEKGIKAKTYRSVVSSLTMLLDFAKSEELADLTPVMVKTFLYYGRVEKGWKSKTFRNHWQYLKIFFDWCVKNQFVRLNPVAGIEKPKLEKYLPRCISTPDAQKVLFHTIWYPWRYELEKMRNEAIIAALMTTGLRLQELLNLEVKDINFENSEITVNQGKGRKDRIVPIHFSLLPILKRYFQYRREAGRPSRWFFTGFRSDKQLSQKDIRIICRKISIASGVKFTPHMLRHTFAREMIDKDFNLYKLKEIMGHADIRTTQRYLSISMQGIKNSFGQVKLF